MTTPLFMLLGATGATGRRLAPLLLQETQVRLLLAARSASALTQLTIQLNTEFPGERVTYRVLDAADASGMRQALQAVQLLLVASGTAHCVETTARAALEAGCDWLDIQYSGSKLNTLQRLRPAIEQRQSCFITDGGFHPGLAAVVVREAARQLDELTIARVASLIKLDWQGIAVTLDTVREMVQEFAEFQSLVWRDDTWHKLSLTSSSTLRRFVFAPPFGEQLCTPMLLQEMLLLPELFPQLRETGFYVGGFNPVTDKVVIPLIFGLMRLAPHRGLSVAARLLHWSLRRFGRPPYHTILQLEASGRIAGKERQFQLSLSHPDGYQFTAIPVVATLLQYLDDSVRRPGLHFQAQLVELERLLRDMARLGVEVTSGWSESDNGSVGQGHPQL